MYTIKVIGMPGTFCKFNTEEEVVSYLLERGWKKESVGSSDNIYSWRFKKGNAIAQINEFEIVGSKKVFETIYG